MPVSGADLSVYVETETEKASASTLIASGHTNPVGKFNFAADLANARAREAVASATRNPDGSVFLEIMADNGGVERYFNLDAVPPAPRRDSRVWGDVADPNLLPDVAAAKADDYARNPLDLELSLSKENSGVGKVKTYIDGEQTDIVLQDHEINDGQCRNIEWWWMPDTGDERWIRLTMIGQRNRSAQLYRWESTYKTKVQLVYGLEGKFQETAVGGGLSYSGEDSSGAFFEHTFPKRDLEWYGVSRANWYARMQKKMCETGWTDSYGTRHSSGWTDSRSPTLQAEEVCW